VFLRATVENMTELRWWLLGFGELVEVLAPADLGDEFRERAMAMAARYQQRPQPIATRPRHV
jgi:predicted DNA-binding transcriptional regulator YafY